MVKNAEKNSLFLAWLFEFHKFLAKWSFHCQDQSSCSLLNEGECVDLVTLFPDI